ncbi:MULTISPECIES: YceD family protein [Pontibacillus]|uniref:YceD family protein n=1 Tax=Pontibacillus chungwhensis TaxID=265426 RepID=A0ABY8V2L2_9BACI|nr:MULTISPECIES: YceD family protein [Pontibacillus]MCD5322575.1 YceD family protein [Pontibacillus sp. HN14]WIF99860.1 YceD family protein [Pontibacillus chungwhensis]
MKFALQKLKAADLEPVTFDDRVDISELEEMPNDIRSIPDVHVKGEATRNGDTVTFRFAVSGTMTLPCARTLADVNYPFSFDAVEVFSLSPYHQEGEDEIHEIAGEVLDLTPYIKENVILEVPLQVFADDEVLDDALSEGQGWQLITEEKQEEKVDPRLAKLQQFLDDNKE